jgi:hypothetical protein
VRNYVENLQPPSAFQQEVTTQLHLFRQVQQRSLGDKRQYLARTSFGESSLHGTIYHDLGVLPTLQTTVARMHNKSLPRNMPLQWVSNGAGLTPTRPLVSKSSLLTDAGHALVHELLQFYGLKQEA